MNELLEEIQSNLAVIDESGRFDNNYKNKEIVHSDSFFGDVRYDKINNVLVTNVVNDHAEMHDEPSAPVQFYNDFTDDEYDNLAKIVKSAFKKNKDIKKFISKHLYKNNTKQQLRLLKGLSSADIDIHDANSIDVWYSNGEFDYIVVVTINKQLKYKIKRKI